jgi:vacuolar protein sorting-associated protein VTA1
MEPQHTSQDYYSTETPAAPYNYPNFQSYSIFQDRTSPAPTHQSPFYPAADAHAAVSFSTSALNPSAPTHYNSSADAGHHVAPPATPPASQYKYDSNYQPSVEKITDANKAARFADGALAFDDVSIAVDHLKRALMKYRGQRVD